MHLLRIVKISKNYNAFVGELEVRMRTITEGKSVGGTGGGIPEGKELCRPGVHCQAVRREDH